MTGRPRTPDAPGEAADGSACAFPNCQCPGDTPACPDYEQTSDEAWLSWVARGCPE